MQNFKSVGEPLLGEKFVVVVVVVVVVGGWVLRPILVFSFGQAEQFYECSYQFTVPSLDPGYDCCPDHKMLGLNSRALSWISPRSSSSDSWSLDIHIVSGRISSPVRGWNLLPCPAWVR